MCDGVSAWNPISGSGSTGAFGDDATCASAADAGKVRFNSTSGKPEFCDGTGWVPFALSSPTGSLVITPASNYSMHIVGPCSGADCPYKYGSWQTFTVSNQGLTATSTLNVPTITGPNATNFQMDAGASTCDNGIALAASNQAGNSCTIVVRALAGGNSAYSAQINVTGGSLSAVAPLYGVGSQFTCGSGTLGWGGIVLGNCTGAGGTEPGTGQTIIQQAGCSSSTFEPTCTNNPGNDPSFNMTSGSDIVAHDAANSSSGLQNTITNLAYNRSMPAISYCTNLVKDGYDDWYMPSYAELQSFYADTIIRAMFSSNIYWSSTYHAFSENADMWKGLNVTNNTGDPYFYRQGTTLNLRCARKHNTAAPAATADRDPVYLGYINGGAPNMPTRYTSDLATYVQTNSLPVVSFNTPITVSVAGTGSPEFRVNNGAWMTSGSVSPGVTTIEFRALSPAAYGQERVITLNIGDDSGTWRIRTYDPSIAKNIFVTSTNYNGNLGGLSGANNLCRTRANFAGLAQSGTYQAFIATSGNSALDNIGWNWGVLQNLGVASVVASSPAALTAGTLSASPNRTEFGVIKSSNVWGGTGYNYYPPGNVVEYTGSTGYNCTNWTSTGGNGSYGQNGQTNQLFFTQWYSGNQACSTLLPLYCVGPNPDLPNITCPGAVDATASKSSAGSYNVTVPAGCTVTFKMWGGAGGADMNCNGQGGGGGYAQFSETPATATTYHYFVGGSGQTANSGSGGSSASGFGGGAGNAQTGTGGGGASVLYRDTVSPANLIAVAAGGGGTYGACGNAGKAGGQSNNSYSTTSTQGQSAPGSCDRCGGGGGGYDGSAGGGGNAAPGGYQPGSGGSNWVATGAGISSSTAAGSVGMSGNYGDTQRPGNAGQSHYPSSANSVNDGAVVVIY
jgi:hypothetical protein